MKSIITLTLLTLTFATAFYFASIKADKVYCLKLQSQSQEFDNFKVAVWENEMCEELNLPVEALINHD